MQERSKIAAFVCLVAAVLLSFLAVVFYTPAIINGLEVHQASMDGQVSDTDTYAETNIVWEQNKAAHDLALLQSRCGSRNYQYACLEHLVDGYYHPMSAWSAENPELGEEIHRRYLELYQERTKSTESEAEQSYINVQQSVSEVYGFSSVSVQGYAQYFQEPAMEYAAYQFMHTSKADAKETFLEFVETANEHYNCTEFLQFVLYSDSADHEDIAWVKAQAARLIPILEAEESNTTQPVKIRCNTLRTFAAWQE